MDFTGERYLPELTDFGISYEHWHRYLYATQFAAGLEVLDVACGEGYGSFLLAKYASSVTGVDIDANSIHHASSKYQEDNLSFLKGSADAIPLKGQHLFDLVVSFETIEHLDGPTQRRFLEEVKRLLRPGGTLLISTPDRYLYTELPEYHNEFHLQEFNLKEFETFLHCYFPNVVIAGQDIYTSSVIHSPGKDTGEQLIEFNLEIDGAFHPKENPKGQDTYLIAVCSENPLVQPPPSLLYNAGNKRADYQFSYQVLYLDTGKGFNEYEALRLSIREKEKPITFTLTEFEGLQRVRFDPAASPVYLKIKSVNALSFGGQEVELAFSTNALQIREELYLFDTDDPQILVELPFGEDWQAITFHTEYLALGDEAYPLIVKWVEENHGQLANRLAESEKLVQQRQVKLEKLITAETFLRSELDEAQARFKVVSQNNNDLEIQLKRQQAEWQKLEKEHLALGATLDEKIKETTRLAAEVELKDIEAEQLSSKLEVKTTEAATLTQKVVQLETAIAAKQAAAALLTTEKLKAEKRIVGLEAELKKLEVSLADSTRSLEETEISLRAKEATLSVQIEKAAKFERKLQQAENSIERLKTQLLGSEKGARVLHEKISLKDQKIEKLKSKTAEQERLTAHLRMQIKQNQLDYRQSLEAQRQRMQEASLATAETHQAETTKLKENTEFILRKKNAQLTESQIELNTLRRSLSFQFGLLVTAPIRLLYNQFSNQAAHHSKLWFWGQFVVTSFRLPGKMLRNINRKNLVILTNALRYESPSQIIDNLHKFLLAKQPQEITGESAQNTPISEVLSEIEKAELVGNRLIVNGWALASEGIEQVDIYSGEAHLGQAKFGLSRLDVANAFPDLPGSEHAGFAFAQEVDQDVDEITVVAISQNHRRKAVFARPIVSKPVFTMLPDCLRLIQKIESKHRSKPEPIDIIVPVYNGFGFLETLFEDIRTKTDLPYRLIVVEDGSPDQRVRPFLKNEEQVFDGKMKLILNEKNLGFVRSVNVGMRMAQEHFVILNTDVELPVGWASRLMRPILENADIASTTPFTNSGTICSFPIFLEDNPIFDDLSVDQIDSVFKKINPEGHYHELPTGVGFCMGMNKQVLDKIGSFDEEAFGKGYGEENDWCRRAAEAGHRNVIVPNLFVYHKHGGSFPSEEKKVLIRQNSARLLEKHPDYNELVQSFIGSDPCQSIREMALMLAACTSEKAMGKVLVIDHAAGGGANAYRRKRISNYLQKSKTVLLVTFDSVYQQYQMDFSYREHRTSFFFNEITEINQLVKLTGLDEIFVNELVGFSEPLHWVDFLTKMKKSATCRLILPVHDFFAVCPSFNLLNDQGKYCGVPDSLDVCQKCIGKVKHTLIASMDLVHWRTAWGKCLTLADEVICFSNNSKEILLKAYPFAEKKTKVEPHQVDYIKPISIQKNSESEVFTIGIIGAINFQKGAAVVFEILEWVQQHPKQNVRVVVIGELHLPEVANGKHFDNLIVTGRYRLEALPGLFQQYQVDACLLPSICPETFSYTTEEIILMGLPLVVFNLGAPAERVAKYPKGELVELDSSPSEIVKALRQIATKKKP